MPEANFMVHADTGKNYFWKTLEHQNISFWYRTTDLLDMLKLYFHYSVLLMNVRYASYETNVYN